MSEEKQLDIQPAAFAKNDDETHVSRLYADAYRSHGTGVQQRKRQSSQLKALEAVDSATLAIEFAGFAIKAGSKVAAKFVPSVDFLSNVIDPVKLFDGLE